MPWLLLAVPQGGRVTIDGQDVATVVLHSLRQQIALVPQQVYLFNASVRDNIAFGALVPTPAAIERSRAVRAGARLHRAAAAYDTYRRPRRAPLGG